MYSYEFLILDFFFGRDRCASLSPRDNALHPVDILSFRKRPPAPSRGCKPFPHPLKARVAPPNVGHTFFRYSRSHFLNCLPPVVAGHIFFLCSDSSFPSFGPRNCFSLGSVSFIVRASELHNWQTKRFLKTTSILLSLGLF